jgi:hypothetical protein
MRFSRHAKILLVGFAVFALVTLIASVIRAQEEITAAYMYYGREWSRDEMLQRYESGEPFHCVQQITEQTLRNDAADLFLCFDTLEEAQRNSEEIQPDVEGYNEAWALRNSPGLRSGNDLPRTQGSR